MAATATKYKPARFTSRCPECRKDEEFVRMIRGVRNPQEGFHPMLDFSVGEKKGKCPRGHSWATT